MSWFNIQIEDSLWNKFKAKCAIEGKTIKQKILELIKSFVGVK
jgi:hypothetical protein